MADIECEISEEEYWQALEIVNAYNTQRLLKERKRLREVRGESDDSYAHQPGGARVEGSRW